MKNLDLRECEIELVNINLFCTFNIFKYITLLRTSLFLGFNNNRGGNNIENRMGGGDRQNFSHQNQGGGGSGGIEISWLC